MSFDKATQRWMGFYRTDEEGNVLRVQGVVPRNVHAECVVAKDAGEGWCVSTVFLEIDHGFQGPPLLWESWVSGPSVGARSIRYASLEEARQGHAALVKEYRGGG